MTKLQKPVSKFINNYKSELSRTFLDLDTKKIGKIIELIRYTILKKKKIFTCGNGGSASVSNHFLCDFNKGVKHFSKKKIIPKVISLSNSIENITAISNDENFDEIFKNQLENYLEKGDLLIALSCSGKSKNILNALKFAKKEKCRTILITGFKKNVKYTDIHLNINVKNYGISEDIFQSIMHISSQFLKVEFNKRGKKKYL
jgi:phosphoheptose isomerase|tara:strand:- start:25314 stop:25919 length:606 start_codon:yes stop_codon:yes gene_type:complete